MSRHDNVTCSSCLVFVCFFLSLLARCVSRCAVVLVFPVFPVFPVWNADLDLRVFFPFHRPVLHVFVVLAFNCLNVACS